MTVNRFLLWALVLLLSACDDKPPTTPAPPRPFRFDLSRGAGGKLRGPAGLPAQVIAELAEPDADVRVTRNGSRALLVARRRGRWLAGPLAVGKHGGSVRASDAAEGLRDVAPAPKEAAPAALAARGRGFVLAWVQPVQAGHELWALGLGADGSPARQAVKLSRAHEPIEWVEVVEGGATAYAFWEVKELESSKLLVAAIGKAGAGEPAVVARSVAGWHAAAGPRGAAIAWVTAGEKGRGRVHAAAVDPRGKLRPPIALSERDSALVDVQVAALGEGFAVAWTDTADDDPHVQLARIDAGGALKAPARPPLAPVGGQALVSLVASADRRRVLLAWEHDARDASGARSIELALVEASGALAPARAELELHAGEAPHLVADGAGFAALTLAPLSGEGATKDRAPTVPTFVRFDAELAVRTAEPVRVDALARKGAALAGVPAQVQRLECDGGLCTVVARGEGAPALLLLVALPVRQSPWRKPARRLPAAQPPRALRLDSLAETAEPLADVSAARLGDGRTLVAWITHVMPDETGAQPAPARAKLAFRFVEADGKPGPVRVLSERAISIGGVKAIAVPPGERDPAVALLAWVGPQNRDAQIYLTAIDAAGKTARQKTVTKITRRPKAGLPNEVFDVDVSADGQGGFVCAWADTRDGDLEIYAARVDRQLEKQKGDRRVTSSPGPSTEASVRVAGNRVLLLWSDAREAEPRADIHAAVLDRASLELVSAPRKLAGTPAHSRTPRWAGGPGALAASWIEERAHDAPSEAPGELRLVAMNDAGEPMAAARRVQLTTGAPITSAVVGCEPARCRGVVVGSSGGALSLAGFSAPRESGAPLRARPLAKLRGGTAQDVSLAGADSALEAVYFTQDTRTAVGAEDSAARLRRLLLSW